MTKRINARLPPELSRRLAELQRRTGKSVTDLVREALESYYVASRATSEPAMLLAEFVGCGDGSRTLSTNYKKELRRSLRRKV